MTKKINVNILGLGYIGLPLAGVLASSGYQVLGTDIDSSVVKKLQEGKSHIDEEPGLADLISNVIDLGTFSASTEPRPADIYIIAVPTPINSFNKTPDISYVENALESIAHLLKSGDLILIESTSPIGTSQLLAKKLESMRVDLKIPNKMPNKDEFDIHIAYCPERILPGNIIEELYTNNRIVGGLSSACSDLAASFYASFVKSEISIASSAEIAEMVKLTENSYRDVNIAFANELSLMCDEKDVSVHELITLSNQHPRVNILQPGCGVGGHCIAVDPWFMVSSFPSTSNLIKTARLVNDYKPKFVIEKFKKLLENLKRHKQKKIYRIGILGITFKPDVSDLRESPALEILNDLCKIECTDITVFEPNLAMLPESLRKKNIKLSCISKIKPNLSEFDIICSLVAHKQFAELKKNSHSLYIDPIGLFEY